MINFLVMFLGILMVVFVVVGILVVALEDEKVTWGILFRWQSVWLGAHWSEYNKRLCVNAVPFITLWVTWPGGNEPSQGHDILRSRK